MRFKNGKALPGHWMGSPQKRLFYALLLPVLLGIISCSMKSEYQQMVDEALASGIRQDSIFLGLSFGMGSDEFYKYCWEMNRQQIFRNGPKNISVEYDISDHLRHPGKMNFYPTFYEDKIYEMPVAFSYDAFSWQDTYGVDTLLVDVLQFYTKWYGAFKEFKHPEKGSVFVNIDGNRQIRLFKNSWENSVNAVFTDLSVDRKAANKAQDL